LNPFYLLALLIGLSLGIIGSGGSILTVPVLVYLFHLEPLTATTYSLFIVGTASAMGAAQSIFKKNIDIKAALLFVIPSLMSVFLMRNLFLQYIPSTISFGIFELEKNIFIMIFFSVIMIAAAISMIRSAELEPSTEKFYFKLPMLGFGVGLLTGLVGAGGGFLIIPSLILFANVDMKKAVGTSLLIITINSYVGFLSTQGFIETIDWNLLLTFTSLSIVGILIGISIQSKIPQKNLKQYFGYFIIVIACYIVYKELFSK